MTPALDIAAIRAEFPQLTRLIHGKPLIYFDNANTAQRPQSVVAAVDRYYHEFNANVSRAVHTLGSEATVNYEAVRDKLARFINAERREQIVFTSGTTAATNLVAYAWLMPRLQPGDVVLASVMEHHANIVPWQIVAGRSGAKVMPTPITQAGEVDLEGTIALLNERVKLLCITHVSNVLGTINPLRELIDAAHARGIPVLVDGSQAVPHMAVDMQALGCDFYVLTGHKMFGPTGTGALWAKTEILEAMPPFMGGGEMINAVSFEKTTFACPPHRFEAGTPNIAGFVGLGAAIDWMQAIGMQRIAEREQQLTTYALAQFAQIPGLRLFGQARQRASVFSFLIDGLHAHDLATLLDYEGIAVRSGHHCAHPLMQFYGIAATTRVSLAFYNTCEEIDAFVLAIAKVRKLLE
ncbi:MAG: cysteine desulfurase CsdA [Lysobacterales bacterium CG02_land_8_20_14_3_00_62_12]|nr:MAG: cysteine desulfurase CsdA [Xanthomonadales bacterium CG02_land_8_20_14_3_00_62_12]